MTDRDSPASTLTRVHGADDDDVERVGRVRLLDLLTDVEVEARRGDSAVEVTSLTHDSRLVEPGGVFACLVGARTDGHVHAGEAISAGAVALLVERPLDLGVPEAQVADVRRALGRVAAALHGHPSSQLRCLGVTGTNGKTTTTYLVEAVARAAGERVGVIGTTGARVDGTAVVALGHTTPEASELQALLAAWRDHGVQTVAMEVSSHALDQHRVDAVNFKAVAFTNLTPEHLDYHGSAAAYFEAKARLFEAERTAAAVINVDDEAGIELAARARNAGLDTFTFGIAGSSSNGADLLAEELHLDDRGSRFVLSDRRNDVAAAVELGLVGRFNVANALAAAGLWIASGGSLESVATGLGSATTVPGRLEPVDAGQSFTVLVDYAHSPDALTAALGAARLLAGPHRVLVVFGCGGDRDREKRPLMGRAAALGADLAVLTNDNPRSEAPGRIADAVLEGLAPGPARVLVELDRRAAIRAALSEATPGDVVLIAGKGHEIIQVIGSEAVPFDDRVVARQELLRRAAGRSEDRSERRGPR